MDLKERFDQAMDGGPAHTPIQERLVAGRRATRRRRTAMGATALAMAVVVGGIGWAGSPGTQDEGDRLQVTDRTGATTSTSTPPAASQQPEVRDVPEVAVGDAPPGGNPILLRYDAASAELEMAPGIVIERRIDNPMKREGIVSTAAVVTRRGERWWAIAAVLPGRSGSGWGGESRAIGNRTFEQWVREHTVLNTEQMFAEGVHDPGWVTLDDDGRSTAHNGATIIGQTVPADQASASQGKYFAIAMIEVDGARLCANVGSPDVGLDVFYIPESEYQGCGNPLIGGDDPGNPETPAP